MDITIFSRFYIAFNSNHNYTVGNFIIFRRWHLIASSPKSQSTSLSHFCCSFLKKESTLSKVYTVHEYACAGFTFFAIKPIINCDQNYDQVLNGRWLALSAREKIDFVIRPLLSTSLGYPLTTGLYIIHESDKNNESGVSADFFKAHIQGSSFSFQLLNLQNEQESRR
jgi:hypothetical protein